MLCYLLLTRNQGPGFGKTTAVAVFTVAMMARVGVVYCSAPTHVAVDNFAARLDSVVVRVTKRRNQGHEEATRIERKLVVRGFAFADEEKAFMNLLQNPHAGDAAAPTSSWTVPSRWTFNLSLAFWLLVALRSPGTRRPDETVPETILALRASIDKRIDLGRLRAVATGDISWQEYHDGAMAASDKITGLFKDVMRRASAIATTPARGCQEPFSGWRKALARGIAVDEAANMSRPDLISVWGNTLMPLVLAGDDKQLSPAVLTMQEKDALGNFVNRFGADGKISPLTFLKTAGWPVYRLQTQLRMARGLFDLCHREVYSDVPFTYGPQGDISLPQHTVGRALEAYFRHKFATTLRPCPAGTLQPIFVHCPGSRCLVNTVTGSKQSPDQVEIALDLASEFVKASKVDAGTLVIISPYQANVELVARMRQLPKYSATLARMPPAATVDSFQGREGDIAFVVFGTTKAVGPGFTTDEQRLNVMLSRQRSGLVIVGDLHVAGDVEGPHAKGKAGMVGKGGKNAVKVHVQNAEGEWTMIRVTMLHNVGRRLLEAGRVVRVERKA